MARKPSDKTGKPAALTLARHYQAVTGQLPGRVADAPHERPGGLVESNAAFEVRDGDGRVFTVIVARIH